MISLREDMPPDGGGPFEREVAEIFSESGLLSGVKNFEWRPEQQRMAAAVARTLEANSHLVVEAGTGVGKSLAYLVPAALHAVRSRRKAVISTHTINLQEQLIYKDIPLAQKVLPVEFGAALFKGRHNYCCGTRLDRALRQAGDLFTDGERGELERIREWSQTTRDGSLSDFAMEPDAHVWAQVCSERNVCTQRTCAKNPRCFYQAMRRRVLGADIVVVNHTLFFTLLGGIDEEAGAGAGFLFPHDFAIFDEAHTLEGVASRHIGLAVSQYGLRSSLQRLYNPRTRKGLFQAMKQSPAVAAVGELLPEADAFFGRVAGACRFSKGRAFRVREPGLADAGDLCDGLSRVAEAAARCAGGTDDEAVKAELSDAAARLRETRKAIGEFLQQQDRGHVYWVEEGGKREPLYTLNAAPIDLAASLRRLLFRDDTCSVMTSATLSVGDPEMGYFRGRVGAEEVPALQIGSPFDYRKQMTLHLVRRMPDPRDAGYEAALEEWIAHFTDESRARAFVLFTSYVSMRNVANRMESHFAKKGWRLLVQGEGMARSRMLEEFRSGQECVLFGTDSFWAGVDVPGEALSNVIITRLPFGTPDHPLVEAKLERIKESGDDPFQTYSLPEAILKLRQGVGRLIRAKTDSGIIVVLDSRILSKPYGRAFLRALPECPVEIH